MIATRIEELELTELLLKNHFPRSDGSSNEKTDYLVYCALGNIRSCIMLLRKADSLIVKEEKK